MLVRALACTEAVNEAGPIKVLSPLMPQHVLCGQTEAYLAHGQAGIRRRTDLDAPVSRTWTLAMDNAVREGLVGVC